MRGVIWETAVNLDDVDANAIYVFPVFLVGHAKNYV